MVSEGWSTDPKKLQPILDAFPSRSFGGEKPVPISVSTADDENPLFLLWWRSKFYFWRSASPHHLYSMEPYELRDLLRGIKSGCVELELKERFPLLERPESGEKNLQIGPQEVPKGWSNDIERLDDIRQMVVFQEFGLALPSSIFQYKKDFHIRGKEVHRAYQLFQSGDRYYIFDQNTEALDRIEEPAGFQSILRTLNDTSDHLPSRLKTREVGRLPKIKDSNVPKGWTNTMELYAVEDNGFRGFGLGRVLYTLLYSESYMGKTPAYLFKNQPSSHSEIYLWKPSLDQVYRIDNTDGLLEILAVLANPFGKLKLTLLDFLPGTLQYRIADDDMPDGWSRADNPAVCMRISWRGFGLPHRPTSLLQHTGLNGETQEYLVETGRGTGREFYLWNSVSRHIHRVLAPMGLDGIFDVLKDPTEQLKLEKLEWNRTTHGLRRHL